MKPTVAFFDFASCEGCQLQIVNLENELLDLLLHVDVVEFREAMSEKADQYTIAFIDRTNISLALPSMSRDLHMDPAQAGDAAGVFFWGYLLLQIPGGYLAQRWSAKKFVSILLVLWGLAAVACGLVTTWRELWVMRLLLGVAEGGVWPAVLVMLSHWFPRAERARANAYWMLCMPVAVVVSSPLSGWILGRWDWRVLLIAEGALPFVLK